MSGQPGDLIPRDPRRLTGAERDAICTKIMIVDNWRRFKAVGKSNGAKARQVLGAYCLFLRAVGIEASPGSIYAWDRAYRENGFGGLIDQWGLSKLPPADFSQFFRDLERIYRSCLMRAENAWDLTIHTGKYQPCQIPTLREAKRFLAAHVLPDLRRGG